MAQWVKDLVWSPLWHGPLLWRRVSRWSGNVHMLQVWPKNKNSQCFRLCRSPMATDVLCQVFLLVLFFNHFFFLLFWLP